MNLDYMIVGMLCAIACAIGVVIARIKQLIRMIGTRRTAGLSDSELKTIETCLVAWDELSRRPPVAYARTDHMHSEFSEATDAVSRMMRERGLE